MTVSERNGPPGSFEPPRTGPRPNPPRPRRGLGHLDTRTHSCFDELPVSRLNNCKGLLTYRDDDGGLHRSPTDQQMETCDKALSPLPQKRHARTMLRESCAVCQLFGSARNNEYRVPLANHVWIMLAFAEDAQEALFISSRSREVDAMATLGILRQVLVMLNRQQVLAISLCLSVRRYLRRATMNHWSESGQMPCHSIPPPVNMRRDTSPMVRHLLTGCGDSL